MNTETRMRAGFFVAAAGATVLVASCTAPGQQPQPLTAFGSERQCFNASMVNAFRPVGRDIVHVTISPRRVFELRTIGYCPEINWSRSIALRSTSGSSWVCSGHDAELLVPSRSGQGLDRCLVTGVRQLTPPEVQTWRARRR